MDANFQKGANPSVRLIRPSRQALGSDAPGVILILAVLVTAILIILGTYFVNFTLTESRISKSQKIATQNYYLAEAGVNKAIWKIKNEEPWKTCFVSSSVTYECDCNNWQDSFEMNLLQDTTTTVSVVNTACAQGQIMATSTIFSPEGKTSQRVVKTTVYKSLASPTQGAAVFSGGASENIDITLSKIKIYGNLFSNHNLDIKGGSIVEIYDDPDTPPVLEGQALVNGNLDVKNSILEKCENKCAKNECARCLTPGRPCKKCPPDSASVPLVDFDSASTTSFKSRAQASQDQGFCQNLCNEATCLCQGSPCAGNNKCVLSAAEFEDILWAAGQNGILALGGTAFPQITYVMGSVDLKGGRRLEVNGALVADSTIYIGEYSKWTRGGQKHEGFSQIQVFRPTATTTSGILTKAKIYFGFYSSFMSTSITGVIYANDEIRIVSLPQTFTVRGGIIGRKLSFTSIFEWLDFILDDEVILYGLGYKIEETAIVPLYSPVITVNHWEEEY